LTKRRIVATADIPADTVLFTIPRDAIISVAKSDLPQRLPDVFKERSDWDQDGEEGVQDTSLDSWTSLILVLIYEYLRPDSKWRPYLDVLPQSFETLMFWTENELKELQASAVTTKIGKKEANDMFRSKILPVVSAHAKLFGNSAVSTDESEALRMCHRMGSVIMSYAFDLEAGDDDEDAEQDGWVEDRDDSTILGMVPMADILNADAEFNVGGNQPYKNCPGANSYRHMLTMAKRHSQCGHFERSKPARKFSTITALTPTASSCDATAM